MYRVKYVNAQGQLVSLTSHPNEGKAIAAFLGILSKAGIFPSYDELDEISQTNEYACEIGTLSLVTA
jgi:hypothetical protein